jgi:hypothetical protein
MWTNRVTHPTRSPHALKVFSLFFLSNRAGGAAAEGQRGGAAPRGSGGRMAPCRGSRRRRGTRGGSSLSLPPLWGGLMCLLVFVCRALLNPVEPHQEGEHRDAHNDDLCCCGVHDSMMFLCSFACETMRYQLISNAVALEPAPVLERYQVITLWRGAVISLEAARVQRLRGFWGARDNVRSVCS